MSFRRCRLVAGKSSSRNRAVIIVQNLAVISGTNRLDGLPRELKVAYNSEIKIVCFVTLSTSDGRRMTTGVPE